MSTFAVTKTVVVRFSLLFLLLHCCLPFKQTHSDDDTYDDDDEEKEDWMVMVMMLRTIGKSEHY